MDFLNASAGSLNSGRIIIALMLLLIYRIFPDVLNYSNDFRPPNGPAASDAAPAEAYQAIGKKLLTNILPEERLVAVSQQRQV